MITVRKGFSKGYAPDLPSDDPEIVSAYTLNATANCVPSMFGMERSNDGATSVAATVGAAAAGGVRSAKFVTKSDASTRLIVVHTFGSFYRISELDGSGWTARSATVSGLGTFSIAQFGDTSLVASNGLKIQYSTSGSFATVTGAPEAQILEPVLTSGGGFVLAFNTSDATFGSSYDRWWCSSLNDVSSSTAWVPSIASQCATGRLLGYEGQILAAKQLGGDKVIAYKADSAYVGQYVGPPGVWAWQEFPGIGCVGQNAVCDVNGIHFVVSKNDIYFFDGVRPRSVGDNIRSTFLENTNASHLQYTTVVFDKRLGHVKVFSPTSSANQQDRCIVYNVYNGRWGDDIIRGGESRFAPLAYNSTTAYFNSANQLMTLSGTPSGTATIGLPAIGDEGNVTTLTELRVKFKTNPTAATASVSKSMSFGASVTSDLTQAAYDVPGSGFSIFKFRSTARWHFVTITLTGPYEIMGYEYDLVRAGRR